MKKTALITGASRGIGEAAARIFAGDGYDLALCCHRSDWKLRELAGQLEEAYKVSVITYNGDVADHNFVEQMVSRTLAEFGHIDVLINNAAISYIGLLTDMTIEDWNRIIATNLGSVFSTCRCTVPSMVRARSGCIINISSVWGYSGASCEVAYSASKGGVNSFTKALGKELAPSRVRVNAIACGMIDTAMNSCFSREELDAITEEIPAGRMGTPEEAAALALSLAKGPAYLTGQIITLDGAWT